MAQTDAFAVYETEVMKIVEAIDDLFEIERKARTWLELKSLRESESKPKLEEIKILLQDARAEFFDQDDFCKAANYVLSAWTEFTAFADDIRLPLSNNEAERALRHAVLGRKNFNGSKTINGADVAATPILGILIFEAWRSFCVTRHSLRSSRRNDLMGNQTAARSLR